MIYVFAATFEMHMKTEAELYTIAMRVRSDVLNSFMKKIYLREVAAWGPKGSD